MFPKSPKYTTLQILWKILSAYRESTYSNPNPHPSMHAARPPQSIAFLPFPVFPVLDQIPPKFHVETTESRRTTPKQTTLSGEDPRPPSDGCNGGSLRQGETSSLARKTPNATSSFSPASRPPRLVVFSAPLFRPPSPLATYSLNHNSLAWPSPPL
ncbi:hypothetical protein LZ31DRAFT_546504 [Colletotrichum somersetense]|nr:hypothetical protein LZ31DRAFT_546504 [Colletotrichum somersetense]